VGTREISDDHASDLSHLREVHGVVDRLRQLVAAAFDADQASEGMLILEPSPQPAPGR
jgi:hypothetical protein